MRKITLLLLLSISTCVYADDPVEKKYSICSKVAKLAELIMTSRQIGVELDEMLSDQGKESELSKAMIIDAYSTPRFSSEASQKRSISEFKNEWQLKCIKN